MCKKASGGSENKPVFFKGMMSIFMQVPMTNCHKLGGLQQTNFLTVLETRIIRTGCKHSGSNESHLLMQAVDYSCINIHRAESREMSKVLS